MRAPGEAAARELALLQWAETTAVGDLWNPDDARWATALARASLEQNPRQDFQRERARFAARRLGERDEGLAGFLRRPLWSPRWPLRAALLGLLIGIGLERLGGAQMNLLALPLWGVLTLQLLGYLLFIATRGRSLPLAGLWTRWLSRGAAAGGRLGAVMGRWLRISAPLQQARAALVWHAALLGLSLGLIAGLYGRALQKEYVIGWESTYLQAEQVQGLVDRVLAPASRLSGIAVPAVATLRHGAGQAPRTPAGPWLHLLALTVGLVALPRLALALLAGARAYRLARALPWPSGLGGARDIRLAVVDPEGRLAGSLFGEAGERLASPEGDRLFVQRLAAPPPAPRRRWWQTVTAPAFDLLLAEAPPLRHWHDEGRLLRTLNPAPALQPAWQRLLAQWQSQQDERLERAAGLLADCLAQALQARVELARAEEAPAAVQAMLQPLLREATLGLLRLHGRDGEAAEPQLTRLDAHLQLRLPLPQGRSALLGGVVGGALVGLKADIASGGLTLGGGALLGAVAGGLSAAGLSDWLNRQLDRRRASVRLDASALPALAEAALRRYLAVLDEPPSPAIDEALAAAVAAQDWAAAASGEEAGMAGRLQPLLGDALRRLLAALNGISAPRS